jgi:hypothetical protein
MSEPTTQPGAGGERHVDLHVLGQLAGGARALELMLFEVVGGWVADAEPAALRPLLATSAHHHAWHAQLWAGRSPTVPGIDLDDTTAAGRARLQRLETLLRGLTGTDERIGTTFGVVVPRYAAWCASLRAAIDERLDPSTARVLDLVGRDLHDDARALEPFAPATPATDLDVLDGALSDVEVLRPRD